MYYIYKYEGGPVERISPYKLPGRAELKRFHPGRRKLRQHFGFPLQDLKLYYEMHGKYRIIYIKDIDDKIIHYSYVLPFSPRFTFARKGDLIIFGSWTDAKNRDFKIMCFVMKYVLKRYGSEGRGVYAVFSDRNDYLEDDLQEVGFVKYKKADKTITGRFKILR